MLCRYSGKRFRRALRRARLIIPDRHLVSTRRLLWCPIPWIWSRGALSCSFSCMKCMGYRAPTCMVFLLAGPTPQPCINLANNCDDLVSYCGKSQVVDDHCRLSCGTCTPTASDVCTAINILNNLFMLPSILQHLGLFTNMSDRLRLVNGWNVSIMWSHCDISHNILWKCEWQ